MSVTQPKPEWKVLMDLLRASNPSLLERIGRKMMNYLFKCNIAEIKDLMQQMSLSTTNPGKNLEHSENEPLPRLNQELLEKFIDEVFKVAAERLPAENITKLVEKWLKNEQSRFFTMAAERRDIPLAEIKDAVIKFSRMPDALSSLTSEESVGIKVALIRRFFTEDLDYINVTKKFCSIPDFYEVLSHTIGPGRGNGKLGGKSAGLFRAQQILMAAKKDNIALRNLSVPKTWYLTSDGIMDFLHFNALEELPTIKYRNPAEIRQEYPYLEQIFKNSSMPPEIIAGLNLVLDDFGERPIVVRSSSLLEDTLGSAFAGKYKSLFLANKGTKQERLEALIDAVQEVYASVFGPDPIEYRKERGLLDFNEEMAILIQEVVGRRAGKYFLPAFAGVAFSYNEFRWSPRIKREDGVVRMVMGLGTRAVDRMTNDYPFLFSPGQPALRVNVSPEEVLWYSQKNVDVINLEARRFETVPVERLIQEVGEELPYLSYIISIYQDDQLFQPFGTFLGLKEGRPVITFSRLISQSPFVPQIKSILTILKDTLGWPVDVEFACDGDLHKLYLLQCRPQSHAGGITQVTIPENVPAEDQLFTANKFVTTGEVKGIEYIIYVDPDEYYSLSSLEELVQAGRVIGILNDKLPRRKFVLMGPGRWGSRGDIRLGVRVGYSEINNTAMIIEIAKKQKDYVPEVSYGTHFFQDLVEAQIRYLPLYPDDPCVLFNERFFKRSPNIIKKLIPQIGALENVIRVIPVSKVREKSMVTILMDGEQEKALAFISHSGG
jgi:hypothetical protein